MSVVEILRVIEYLGEQAESDEVKYHLRAYWAELSNLVKHSEKGPF